MSLPSYKVILLSITLKEDLGQFPQPFNGRIPLYWVETYQATLVTLPCSGGKEPTTEWGHSAKVLGFLRTFKNLKFQSQFWFLRATIAQFWQQESTGLSSVHYSILFYEPEIESDWGISHRLPTRVLQLWWPKRYIPQNKLKEGGGASLCSALRNQRNKPSCITCYSPIIILTNQWLACFIKIILNPIFYFYAAAQQIITRQIHLIIVSWPVFCWENESSGLFGVSFVGDRSVLFPSTILDFPNTILDFPSTILNSYVKELQEAGSVWTHQ